MQRDRRDRDGGDKSGFGRDCRAVNAVLEIPVGEIAPLPTLAARIRTDFNRGMGKMSGKFVAILRADHLRSCGDLEAVHIAGALAGRIAGEVSTGATL